MEEEASPFRRPFPTARALLTTKVAGVIVTIVVAHGALVAVVISLLAAANDPLLPRSQTGCQSG